MEIEAPLDGRAPATTSPHNYWFPEELTRRDWPQGLVPRTVHTMRFEEQVARTLRKNPNWFEFVGQVACDKLDFEATIVSSGDGTCPRPPLPD